MLGIRICIVHLISLTLTWNERTVVIAGFLWKQWLLAWQQNQYQKIFEANTFPKWDLNHSNFKQKLYQTISEQASLPKESIKRDLYQKQVQEKSPRPFFHENWKNRNWGHLLTSFQQIASVLMFAMCLLLWLFQTFWWRCFFIFW